MKGISLICAASVLLLAACENSRTVDPNNQIGEQDGRAIYKVTMRTNKFRPGYSENIERKSVVSNYCSNGGEITSVSARTGTGSFGTYTNLGLPMRTEILAYDLTFVCN